MSVVYLGLGLFLSGLLLYTMKLVYETGVDAGRWGELRERLRTAEAKAAEEAFPEPDEPDEPEEEEDDVCLRPGTRVLCRLSGASHTHGVLRGFAMSTPDGPMLAVVDVGGGAPFMPIDVDLVEPAGDGPPVGYRDNAKPNEWN